MYNIRGEVNFNDQGSDMKKRNAKYALLFLAPSLAGFTLFFLMPFIQSIWYSLMDSPVSGNFVGLSNYIKLLSNPIFLKAGVNTLLFTGISVPLIMTIALLLALLLNRGIYLRNIMRTFFISPLVIPVASVVLVWQIVFGGTGVMNGLLDSAGLGAVDWMNTSWARFVVIIVYLWKNAGYDMVLFLAGLQSIPPEYYESAQIDGASAFRRFVNITLVYLTPTSFFVFIISIINSFKVFRETYLIAGSYPHESIYMLQHYMNNMFSSLDYQKLTTAAFILALLIFILVFALFGFERKLGRAIE
jgi:multiple sugar transport system permease protein